jgi:hypothetical protein
METAVVIGLLLAFLPAIVALQGPNPVWKFLAFLFSALSLIGLVALVVPGVLCWIVAWIFAGVSIGAKHRLAGPESEVPARPRRAWVLAGLLVVGIAVAAGMSKEARQEQAKSPDLITAGNNPSSFMASAPSVAPPPTREDRFRAAKENLELTNFSWSKGGFDSIMMATFYLSNKNAFDVKDFEITCRHTAPSGTAIDSNVRTIYEVVKANSKRTIRDFNMGFIHSQVARSNCFVSDLKIVDTPDVPVAKRQPAANKSDSSASAGAPLSLAKP